MAFTVGDIQGRLLLDIDPYQAGLAQARADAAAFEAENPTATLNVDQTLLDAGIAAAAAKLATVAARTATATVRVDQAPLDAGIVEAAAKLATVAARTATATVRVDTAAVYPALAEAQIALADFAKELTSAHLGATAKPFWADVGALRAEIGALSPVDVKVGATVAAALTEITALKGALAAAQTSSLAAAAAMPPWASATQGNLGYDAAVGRWRQMSGSTGGQFATAAQLADLAAALKGGGGATLPAGALAAAQGKSGTKGSGLASLLGGLLGGGGTGGGGLLSALGWGGGKGIGGALGGMASFGSILSLMGFGAEHVAATGVGVAGSLAGAGLGAGFLGLGALGTMGVGMGTDMAGIGQALGDMKTTLTAITKAVPVTNAILKAQVAYNKALITGGINSASLATGTKGMDAALAAYDLRVKGAIATNKTLQAVLRGFSPVARQAVVAAAEQANAFHMLFNAATGTAERIGANILTQAMKVGEKFLPTIGIYATQNMGIIQTSLQPFFKWLDTAGSGGLKIFTNLEKVFQAHLPTGMHAMEQGFELLVKTITIASHFLGPFLTMINKFVTRLNGATFSKWSKFVTDMIRSFQDWFALLTGGTNRAMSGLGGLIGFVIDLFKPAVGLGDDIAKLLTQIFNQIDGWLSGSHTLLHGLFTAHAKELITGIGAIIKAVLPLLESFVSAFALFATGGAKLATPLLEGIAGALGLIEKIPFASTIIGWGAALAFFGPKVMAGFAALFTVIPNLFATFTSILPAISGFFGTLGGDLAGLAARFGVQLQPIFVTVGFYISSFFKMVASGAAVIGRFVAESITSFGALVASMFGVDAASVGMQLAFAAIGAVGILALAVGIFELYEHFGLLRTAMIVGAVAVLGLTVAFIALDAVPIVAVIAGIGLAIIGIVAGIIWLVKNWRSVWNEIKSVTMDVVRWFESLPGKILHLLGDLGSLLFGSGESGANGLVSGFEAVVRSSFRASLLALPKLILHLLGDLGSLLVDAGEHLLRGLVTGIEAAAPDVVHAVEHVGSDILHSITSFFDMGSPSKLMAGVGSTLMQGLTNGITTGSHLSVQAATKAAQAIATVFGSLAKLKSESKTIASVSALLNSLTTALERLSTFGSKAMTVNFTQLTTNFDTITSAVSKLHPLLVRLETDLKGIGTKALGSVSSNLKSLDTVLGHISTAFKTMAAVTENVAKVSVPEFVGAVKQLPGLLQRLMPILVTLRTSLAAMGGPTMKGVMADLRKFGTAITDFGRILTELAKTAKTAAGTTIPADFKLLQQAAKEIATGLTQTWTAIQGAASKKWAAIAQALSQVPGKLETPFKGIKTTFTTIGESLMSGMQVGIEDGQSGVLKAMTDAVTQAVAAAKKAGKIGSPSMLAADEIGSPLMQGVIVGFRSEIPTANATITSWVDTVPLAFKSGGDKAAASLVLGMRQAMTELTAMKKTLGVVGTRLIDFLANAVSSGSTTAIARAVTKVKTEITTLLTLKDAATLAAAGFHATLSQTVTTALTNLAHAFAHAKATLVPSLQTAVAEAIADLTAKQATLGPFAAQLAENLAQALRSGNAGKIIAAILAVGSSTGVVKTTGLKGNAGGPATTAHAGLSYTVFTGSAGGPATTADANLKYYKTPTTGKWLSYRTTIPTKAATTAATVTTTAARLVTGSVGKLTGTLGKGTPAAAKLIGTTAGSTTAGSATTTVKAVTAYTTAVTKANATVKTLTTTVKLLGPALEALTQIFTSVSKTITTSLHQAWTKILTYLETIPVRTRTIGTKIMAGLAVGITAGTSSVVAAMVLAIDRAIAAAKAHAGIKSPSELAAVQIGLPLAQGMAEGILRGSSVIGDAAKSALAEAFGPTFHPPSFGDYGGSSAPVTHNGPLVSVGQLVLHGVDLSNAGAVQAAVRKGLDEYTDTMTQLLGQQGKT